MEAERTGRLSRKLGIRALPVGLIVVEPAIPNAPLLVFVGTCLPANMSLGVVEDGHISTFSGFWKAKNGDKWAAGSQEWLLMAING